MGMIVADSLFTLKGVNGQLELYNDKVVIKRKGALAKLTQGFFKGDKIIYIRQITGMQIKLGTALTNGYIQFTVPGGIESKKGILDATKDENTVMFAKKQNELVMQIKARVESLQQVERPVSTADEIKKYKELLDSGIITENEFSVKKKELLGM
jgi:hypothetical protein